MSNLSLRHLSKRDLVIVAVLLLLTAFYVFRARGFKADQINRRMSYAEIENIGAVYFTDLGL